MNRGRTVAVVGSTGFLGAAAARSLQAAGWTVRGLHRSAPPIMGGRVAEELATAAVVVWAAGSANPQVAEASPRVAESDLHEFTNVVRRLADLDEPPRLVLASSGGTVYDPDAPPPHTETTLARPTTSYGRLKLAMEEVAAGSGLAATALRISNAYGPGQRPQPGQAVLAHWLRAASVDQPLHLFGELGSTRDYVHVDDVAAGVVAVCAGESLPAVLNLGSGRPTSLGELRDALDALAAERGHRLTWVQHEPRGFDRPSSWLAIDAITAAIGWRPVTSLADGLRGMWDWWMGDRD